MSDHANEFMRLLGKISAAAASKATVERVPEPAAITDAFESVHDYNQVLQTNLTVNYAASLVIIHRSWSGESSGSRSLDLCSGPGHLSLLQAEFLGVENVTGVDFSVPMIQIAQSNSKSRGLSEKVKFERGNILELKRDSQATQKFDLVTFTNASHHLNSTGDLSQVLSNVESFLDSNGVFVLTDLARLATDEITSDFVALAGKDYKTMKMDAMYDDFLASMRAAWSPTEMAASVPKKTKLNWYHLVSAGIPYFQALIAVPKSRQQVFVRESMDWVASGLLKSIQAKQDWELTKGSYYAEPLKKVS